MGVVHLALVYLNTLFIMNELIVLKADKSLGLMIDGTDEKQDAMNGMFWIALIIICLCGVYSLTVSVWFFNFWMN